MSYTSSHRSSAVLACAGALGLLSLAARADAAPWSHGPADSSPNSPIHLAQAGGGGAADAAGAAADAASDAAGAAGFGGGSDSDAGGSAGGSSGGGSAGGSAGGPGASASSEDGDDNTGTGLTEAGGGEPEDLPFTRHSDLPATGDDAVADRDIGAQYSSVLAARLAGAEVTIVRPTPDRTVVRRPEAPSPEIVEPMGRAQSGAHAAAEANAAAKKAALSALRAGDADEAKLFAEDASEASEEAEASAAAAAEASAKIRALADREIDSVELQAQAELAARAAAQAEEYAKTAKAAAVQARAASGGMDDTPETAENPERNRGRTPLPAGR